MSTILCALPCSMDGMALKDRIKDSLQGKSAPDIAKKIGVSRSAIYQWLAGDTKNLKLEHLFALAEHTGYSAQWIATGDGTRKGGQTFASNAGPDLSFLTITLQAVEEYLENEGITLEAEAKAKAVTILYEICAERGRVEQPAVARILKLVA